MTVGAADQNVFPSPPLLQLQYPFLFFAGSWVLPGSQEENPDRRGCWRGVNYYVNYWSCWFCLLSNIEENWCDLWRSHGASVFQYIPFFCTFSLAVVRLYQFVVLLEWKLFAGVARNECSWLVAVAEWFGLLVTFVLLFLFPIVTCVFALCVRLVSCAVSFALFHSPCFLCCFFAPICRSYLSFLFVVCRLLLVL